MKSAKETKSEKIILKLNIEAQNSLATREACTIANSIINTDICIVIFNKQFCINESMLDKLNQVIVKFEKYTYPKEEGEDYPLSWIVGDDEALKNIYINEFFESHLNTIEIGSQEWQITITLISICILHEIGHLIMRWKGHKWAPKKFGEAGEYIEKKLFGALICPVIHKKNQDDFWDSTNKFEGLEHF